MHIYWRRSIWPLNTVGVNGLGPLAHISFSVVNTAVLRGWLVEPEDTESLSYMEDRLYADPPCSRVNYTFPYYTIYK